MKSFIAENELSRNKKADPNATVLPSAMSCGIVRNFNSEKTREETRNRSDEWLRAILSTKEFDAVNVHDYYFPSGVTVNGATFQSYLDHIRTVAKESGVASFPVWITETGFISRSENVRERTDPGSPPETGGMAESIIPTCNRFRCGAGLLAFGPRPQRKIFRLDGFDRGLAKFQTRMEGLPQILGTMNPEKH